MVLSQLVSSSRVQESLGAPSSHQGAVQLQRAARMEILVKLACFCLKGAWDVSVKTLMQLKIILLPDLYWCKLSWGSSLGNITLMMSLERAQVWGRSDLECKCTFSCIFPNRMNQALEWIQMLNATFGKSSVKKCRTSARWYSRPTGRAGVALFSSFRRYGEAPRSHSSLVLTEFQGTELWRVWGVVVTERGCPQRPTPL